MLAWEIAVKNVNDDEIWYSSLPSKYSGCGGLEEQTDTHNDVLLDAAWRFSIMKVILLILI